MKLKLHKWKWFKLSTTWSRDSLWKRFLSVNYTPGDRSCDFRERGLLHFPAFGLNTDQKNSEYGHFSHIDKQRKESASEWKRWKIFLKKAPQGCLLITFNICSFIICFVRTHETCRASCTNVSTFCFITNNVKNVRSK